MNNQKKNTSDNQSNLRDDDQAKKNRQVESAEAKVVSRGEFQKIIKFNPFSKIFRSQKI